MDVPQKFSRQLPGYSGRHVKRLVSPLDRCAQSQARTNFFTNGATKPGRLTNDAAMPGATEVTGMLLLPARLLCSRWHIPP